MNLNRMFLMCVLLFASLPTLAEESDYWGKTRSNSTIGANLIMAKKVVKPSAGLLKKYPAKSFTHFAIDLNQDGQDDYIVEKKGKFETCFVKSDLKLQSCEKINFSLMDGFAYEYFISPGKNQMLILLDLSGDEETSEFYVYKFNPKTWKRTRLTYLNPLIEVDSEKYKGIYWGYPWNISDLPVTTKNGEPTIPMVFENGFDKDPEGKKGPSIVFAGTPTQGESTGYYNKLKSKIVFVPLKNLEARLKAGR